VYYPITKSSVFRVSEQIAAIFGLISEKKHGFKKDGVLYFNALQTVTKCIAPCLYYVYLARSVYSILDEVQASVIKVLAIMSSYRAYASTSFTSVSK